MARAVGGGAAGGPGAFADFNGGWGGGRARARLGTRSLRVPRLACVRAGVDPSMEPELAAAIRDSMEEARAQVCLRPCLCACLLWLFVCLCVWANAWRALE